MIEPDPYFLGYRRAEQERLERQGHEMASDSRRLFDQLGLAAGSRVIEIGCGPRGCLDLLSEYVGPTGRVIGVERSVDLVERAQRFIAENRLTNVEVLHADARKTNLPGGSFDVATERLVLVNIAKPEQIVAEMVRLVRPGGVVALHEADLIARIYDPPLAAWERLTRLLDTYAEMTGIAWSTGRQVPRMLREAGVQDIRVIPTIHEYPPGHERRMLATDIFENVRDGLLSKRLIRKDEFNELIGAVKRHLQDPGTLVLSSIYIQAWGHIPVRQPSPNKPQPTAI